MRWTPSTRLRGLACPGPVADNRFVAAKAAKAEGEGAVSDTVERYLEAIFYIDGEGEVVRASRVADWLGVSQPTTGAAIQRMIRDGMLRLGAAKELELTKRGRDLAGEIVRRHRIAERWLVDVLKMDWLEADVEAGRLEHGMSAAVADRLHDLLGRPSTCPHGNPIPGAAGKRRPERMLASLAPGESAALLRVSEVAEREAPDLLRFLGESGFTLNGRIEVVGHSRGAGTVTVKVGGRRVSMSSEVARRIWVEA
ncbi:MAG: metal-dependent transcriptional regulator [Chloroflexi bacterium]|nr:metal-dependent transcriptional regulator [Chloroflexota bacterium]